MDCLGYGSYYNPIFDFKPSKEFEDKQKRTAEQHKIKKQRFKPVTWYSVIYK